MANKLSWDEAITEQLERIAYVIADESSEVAPDSDRGRALHDTYHILCAAANVLAQRVPTNLRVVMRFEER